MEDMRCFEGIPYPSSDVDDIQEHTNILFDLSRDDPILTKLDKRLLCQYIHSKDPDLYPFPWSEDSKGLRLITIAVKPPSENVNYGSLDSTLRDEHILHVCDGTFAQHTVEHVIQVQWNHVPALLPKLISEQVVLKISDTTIPSFMTVRRNIMPESDSESDNQDLS